MKSKLLFLVAMLFLAMAIFSCQKEKEPETNFLEPQITKQVKLPPKAKERNWSGCYQEGYSFTLGTNPNGRLDWTIENTGDYDLECWLMTRHYVNSVEVASWHAAAAVNVNVGMRVTTNIFGANEPEDRVYFIYHISNPNASNWWCYQGPGLKTYGFKATKHPGITEINGFLQYNRDHTPLPKKQLYLHCRDNGNLIVSIPIRVTAGGIHMKHHGNFEIWIDDGVLNGADEFEMGYGDDYPN